MASASPHSKTRREFNKRINRRKTTLPRSASNYSSLLRNPSTRWILLGTILLVCATVALYSPIKHHPFVNYDDNEYVTENVHLKDGLSLETIHWAFTSYYAANWHPLTWLSHALDYQFFQLDPAGHHTSNLVLHAINVILLFWVLWRATGRAGSSLMVAALFALHPINVESVAWVSERKNLLSMLFFLLTLGAYRWYTSKPRVGRYLLVALLFACGLMSKPQVITLPFVLLLWDWWPLRRLASINSSETTVHLPQKSASWLILEKIPLLALSAASAVVTMQAQALGGGVNSTVAFWPRLENAILAYARYLGKAMWPAHFAPIYPLDIASIRTWEVAGAALLLGGISTLVFLARRQRFLAVGWLWFLGTLVPMIGLVQVGRQAMADRYAYLPFLGLFLMICWGVGSLADRIHVPQPAQIAVGMAVLVPLTGLTHRQINYWSDNVGLWTHTLQVTTNNYQAEDNLGIALELASRRGEAMVHYARAIKIEPSYVFGHVHLGTCRYLEGDLTGALQEYKKVLDLTQNDIPHYAEVRYAIFVNMAAADVGLKDYRGARESLESAVRLNPDNPEEWTNLGIMAQRSGDIDRAIQAYSEAVKLQPTRQRLQLLGQAFQQAGRVQEAQAVMQQAATLPDNTAP